MGILLGLLVIVLMVAATVTGIVKASAVDAAYAEGFRAGLKRAAQIAQERGNIAIQVSPEGRLGIGVLRGQMAHAIELEILGAMAENR